MLARPVRAPKFSTKLRLPALARLFTAEHSGAMLALMAPKRLTADLAKISAGEQDGDHHVTVVYLGKGIKPKTMAAIKEAAQKVCAEHDPVQCKLGGIGAFRPSDSSEGRFPIFCAIDAPGLDLLRADLWRAVLQAGASPPADHGFTPHLTLGYADSEPDLGEVKVPEAGWAAKHVCLVEGDARTGRFALGGGQ